MNCLKFLLDLLYLVGSILVVVFKLFLINFIVFFFEEWGIIIFWVGFCKIFNEGI